MNIRCISKFINNLPETLTTVLFILTDGEDKFNWWVIVPTMSDAELAAYLESRIEDFRCKIYAAQFPGGIPGTIGNETLLESWQRWEANGCVNLGGELIVKISWVNSFEYNIYEENFKTVKADRIRRLLKKGLIAEAIIEKGGL